MRASVSSFATIVAIAGLAGVSQAVPAPAPIPGLGINIGVGLNIGVDLDLGRVVNAVSDLLGLRVPVKGVACHCVVSNQQKRSPVETAVLIDGVRYLCVPDSYLVSPL
ncbi:hypothetical protein GQ42DRAFT_173473 [Ramicandelaber brevisporus]|nr:hypothetical protein GQ42DRAFT_173473 [Ramicandelaber brevisporus]